MSERAERRAALMERLLAGVARRLGAMLEIPAENVSVDYIPPVDPLDDVERQAEAEGTRVELRALRVKLITCLRSLDELETELDDPDDPGVVRARELAVEERVAELEREIEALAARIGGEGEHES